MTTETMTPTELAQSLRHFTGSETFVRWSPLTRSILTEGCKYLADHAGAYWLFDAIDSHLIARGVDDMTEFTTATLKRMPGEHATDAVLELDDGNGTIWMTQHIPYTDFPLPEIRAFAVFNGRGWTHMLPSEY